LIAVDHVKEVSQPNEGPRGHYSEDKAVFGEETLLAVDSFDSFVLRKLSQVHVDPQIKYEAVDNGVDFEVN